MYKNKQRVCNIEELSCADASQRAEDLALKLRVLRQRRRDEARAAGIPAEHASSNASPPFATGTPIANSLGELWVMQTYLRPDLLRAAGVADLGDWGAAFTATVTTSRGQRHRHQAAAGHPGRQVHQPARTAGPVGGLHRCRHPRRSAGGAVRNWRPGSGKSSACSPTSRSPISLSISAIAPITSTLAGPHRDNVLKISNDGRNASLDPRLAQLGQPSNSRAAAVAEQIMRIHSSQAERVYLDHDTGKPLARTGPLQIVFCDRGTPSKDAAPVHHLPSHQG